MTPPGCEFYPRRHRREIRPPLLAAFIALVASQCFAAPPGRQAREEALANSLLAPCCYAEPVSRHASETALKMRLEIARFLDQGLTDRQIIDTYVQRYGAKVYAPPKRTGPWAYLVPWAALLAGLWLCVRWLRRHGPPRVSAGDVR